MKTLPDLPAITMITFLILVAVALSIPFSATAVSDPTSAAADQCIQKTRSMLYTQISNTKYACEFDGKKLLINEFGRMTPAPEGVYRKLGDGKECRIGKGGFVLSCNL
ncbi:MAG: hypothetical protein HZB86_01855 [Deltaproteobacteria bacterium]|nr:hypothetical protein [Deltaproteobacteria bacterium]